MKMYKFVFALVLAGLLAACSSNPFVPTKVTFTKSQLQAVLDKKFPVEKHYMQMLDLTVSNPVVSLRPESNRIAIRFDVELTMVGSRQPVYGQMVFASALVYDAKRLAIVLKDPVLEKQEIVGISSTTNQLLSEASAVLIKENLEGRSVHNCKPGDLVFLDMPLKPRNIEVTQDGVVMYVVR